MARYTTKDGVLVENWNIFYTRNRQMQELKIRDADDGIEIALGDERFVLHCQGLSMMLARLGAYVERQEMANRIERARNLVKEDK